MEARKVAITTGGSQGIGAGLVDAFRGIGYAVVANSRSIEASEHPDLITVAGDISDPAVAQKVVATALEEFGRIDTLVNNAGVFVAKPFTEYTQEDYDNVLQVNLGGFFHITQKAIAQMVGQGRTVLRHEVPRHRVRRPGHSNECRFPRNHRDAHAF